MQIAIKETRWIEVRKIALERLQKCERENLCVACMEPMGGDKPIRGCHIRCYHATRRAILAGKVTEAERLKAGKLTVPRGGRPPVNPVTVELSN